MKNNLNFFAKCCFIWCFLFPVACSQQEQDNSVLELYIITILSDLQANVKVTLYANETDWALEQNPVAPTQSSNAQGRVRFLGLLNQTYFIDVQKDSLNNWEVKNQIKIQTQSAFEVVKELIIVGKTESGLLSNAKGKKWQLITPLPPSFACRTDDILVFYKGNRAGKYEFRENVLSCSVGSNAVLFGEWNIQNQVLTTKINGNIDFSAKILALDKNTLILENSFLGSLTYVSVP